MLGYCSWLWCRGEVSEEAERFALFAKASAPHGRGLRRDVEAAGSLRAAREGSERALRGPAPNSRTSPSRDPHISKPGEPDLQAEGQGEGARLEGERGGGN